MLRTSLCFLFLIVSSFGLAQNSNHALHPFLEDDWNSLTTYISKNLVYPADASNKGIEGTVHLQLSFNPNGDFIPLSVKTVSGLWTSCDAEAERLVKAYAGKLRLKRPPINFVHYILPVQFVLRRRIIDVQYPLHKLPEPIRTTVVSKGLKTGNPQWAIYPTTAMDIPFKSISQGDTVNVTGWGAYLFFIQTPFVSGYISTNALQLNPRLDSVAKVIEEKSHLEPPAGPEKVWTVYDTIKNASTEFAYFSVAADKQDLIEGECATITLSFNVGDANKFPLQFHDLGSQIQSFIPFLTSGSSDVFNNRVTEVEGIPIQVGGQNFTSYPFVKMNSCATKPGTRVLPAMKLKMLKVGLYYVKVDTLVSFYSNTLSIKVRPLPVTASPTSFGRYKMIGEFSMEESISTDTIITNQIFQYSVAIRSNASTFRIEPPKFVLPGLTSQLVNIISDDTVKNDKHHSSRTFIYDCIASKPGRYDLTNRISYEVYNPVKAKMETISSKLKFNAEISNRTSAETLSTTRFAIRQNFIVIDASQSMLIEDYEPNRLGVIKSGVIKFLSNRKSCDVGVIFFGGKVRHLDPDVNQTCYSPARINEIDSRLIPNGTAIGDAIWTASMSVKPGVATKKVVVVGDGDNTWGVLSPLEAAEVAKAKGVQIFTIGIGHSGDVKYGVDDFGKPVFISNTFSDRDLKSVAARTGGKYFWIRDAGQLESVLGIIFKE